MLTPRWLHTCTGPVLALFLATNALPRAGIYVHHHAGGGQAHVHSWGEDAGTSSPDRYPHEAHRHQRAGTADGGPGLVAPDDGDAAHTHWQAPFQHATRTETPRLVRSTVVHPLIVARRRAGGFVASLPTPARAPPDTPAA